MLSFVINVYCSVRGHICEHISVVYDAPAYSEAEMTALKPAVLLEGKYYLWTEMWIT